MTESLHDVALGNLVLDAGVVNEAALDACWASLRRAHAAGEARTLAQILVETGLVTRERLEEMTRSAEARDDSADAAATQPERARPRPTSEAYTSAGASWPREDGESARGAASTSTDGLYAGASASSSSASHARLHSSPIDGFQISQKLGSGAMGAVYKALHVESNRVVALKVLPPKLARNSAYIERFQREARAAKRLQHENIVGAYDIGESNGLFYLAMEFVEGHTVRDLVRKRGYLPESDALNIARQIANALAHASEQGVVHRDIKPDNIIVSTNGVAKLCDMGLAKHVSADPQLTMLGAAVGTPWYISPEQARGERQIDTRADLYSLGATLFHIATGDPPFTGPTAAAIMTQHISDPVPPMLKDGTPASPEFTAIVSRLMAKEASARYQSPEHLIEDIDAVLQGQSPRHAIAEMERPAEGQVQDGRVSDDSQADVLPEVDRRAAAEPSSERNSDVPRKRGARVTSTGPTRPRHATPPKSVRSPARVSSRASASKRSLGKNRASEPVAPKSVPTSTRRALVRERRWWRGVVGVVLLLFAIALFSLRGTDSDRADVASATDRAPEDESGTSAEEETPQMSVRVGEGRTAPAGRASAVSDEVFETHVLVQRAVTRAHEQARRNQYGLALQTLRAVLDRAEIEQLELQMPEFVKQAREVEAQIRNEARIRAQRALSAAIAENDEFGRLHGVHPDFRAALTRLENAVPTQLQDLVEQQLAEQRDAIKTAARRWRTDQERHFAAALAQEQLDDAFVYLSEAESILPPEHAEVLETWRTRLNEAHEAVVQRQTQFRRHREEAEAEFANLQDQVNALLVERRLAEAANLVQDAFAHPVLAEVDAFHALLQLERARLADLQRFWRAALEYARMIAESETVVEMPDGRDFRVVAALPVEQRSMRQLGGSEVTLAFVHGESDRTRRHLFSELDAAYAYALGRPGLGRVGGSRLEQVRAEAAFVAMHEPPQAPAQVARILTFLQAEEALDELHPSVRGGLLVQAEARMRDVWADLVGRLADVQEAAEPALKALDELAEQIRAFRTTWTRAGLLPPDSEIARWLDEAEISLEAYRGDIVLQDGAPGEPNDGDAALRARFRACIARQLDASQVEILYTFAPSNSLADFAFESSDSDRQRWSDDGVGLRMRASDDAEARTTLTWDHALGSVFEFEWALEMAPGSSLVVNIHYGEALERCYSVPLGLVGADEEFVPFGLYDGNWCQDASDESPPAHLDSMPLDVPRGRAFSLRLARSAEGEWQLDLDGEILRLAHEGLSRGQVQLVVVAGEATLHRMRYTGPLPEPSGDE